MVSVSIVLKLFSVSLMNVSVVLSVLLTCDGGLVD